MERSGYLLSELNHEAVILDCLCGASAEALLSAAIGKGGPDAEPRIRFVQIGSVTGSTITLPSAALRSSGLELMGSGLGSVSDTALLAAIAGLMARSDFSGPVQLHFEHLPRATASSDPHVTFARADFRRHARP